MVKKSRLAIYPGSFDPITYGHIDVINRAVRIFPDLIVAVVGNPRKKTLFSFDERKEMIRLAIGDKKNNIRIDGFDGLLMDYARAKNASVVVRGLRAISDFEYEFQMALSNKAMTPDIETVFMMSSADYSFVSSRLIKEIAFLGGDVSSFVSDFVARKLRDKIDNHRMS
jgi:pantetheine-phosphate adenylyltransferase